MRNHFNKCVNRTACTDDGAYCRSCGRSHAEIAQIREIMTIVTDFLTDKNYDNHEEFLDYLKAKVNKKLKIALNNNA